MVGSEKPRQRILFITRKYPPHKGGMERVAYELHDRLSRVADVRLVKWGGSNRLLPLVLPLLFLKSILILMSGRVDVIYLQDGLLAPLGYLLKGFRKLTVITIHGSDIIYDNRIYQLIVPPCVNRFDRVVCISRATAEECLKRGIAEDRIVIIPNGISDHAGSDTNRDQALLEVFRETGVDLTGKRILLSVGRIVEHKGYHWFAEQVLPRLTESGQNLVYLIVGEGNLKEKIRKQIAKEGLARKIILLGSVDDSVLSNLYRASDVLVMPNIPVPGRMEGFGVVILEASVHGLPVVASRLQGIADSVSEGENGLLVEPGDAAGFAVVIGGLLQNDKARRDIGKRARKFTLEKYNWDGVALSYTRLLGISG